jgi:DNA-directed RNA polymerase subunit RPC12/RpoP
MLACALHNIMARSNHVGSENIVSLTKYVTGDMQNPAYPLQRTFVVLVKAILSQKNNTMQCPRCETRMNVATRSQRKGLRHGKIAGLVRKYKCPACGVIRQTLEMPLEKADLLGNIFTVHYPDVTTFHSG